MLGSHSFTVSRCHYRLSRLFFWMGLTNRSEGSSQFVPVCQDLRPHGLTGGKIEKAGKMCRSTLGCSGKRCSKARCRM